MGQQSEGPIQVAQAFAALSAKAAQAANQNMLRAAKTNIQIGKAQINLQQSDEKRKLAYDLARHIGTSKVNAAYRGTAGSPSTSASIMSATLLAGREAANISANAAFSKAALEAANNPTLQDVRLAAIEGGLRGFNIGQQIQAGLNSMQTKTTTAIHGGGDPRYGGTPLYGGDTIFSTPGLDLSKLLQGGDFSSIFTKFTGRPKDMNQTGGF